MRNGRRFDAQRHPGEGRGLVGKCRDFRSRDPGLRRDDEIGECRMSYETILTEQRGAVTLITLNRPKALNALNSQVLAELIQAFADFDSDDSQHCAVLTG